jgi:peptide/nickel transport system substrate-binding protein
VANTNNQVEEGKMKHTVKRESCRKLIPNVSQGKMTRREFMAKMSALGIAATLPMTFDPKSAKAASPLKGGILKVATKHGSTTETYDPATLASGFQTLLTRAINNTLTEIDPDNRLVPCLAESWESTPDATKWIFKIRKGVAFQDGRTLNAADAVATINYHRGEKTKSSVKPIVKPIKSIKTDGKYALIIELNEGNADFPYNLDRPGLGVYPAAKDGSLEWKSGNGTGGYVLKEFEPGVRAYFERNPNYWNKDRAHADAAELLSIKDASARTTALVTGQVHVIDAVDPKTAHLLSKKPNIHVEENTGPLHYTFPMLMDVPPFNDNNVRLAIKHGLNRKEMLQLILKGHGTIGKDNPIGPSYRYYSKDLKPIPYDPDKARFYLKKAGLSELSVKLSAADAAFAGAVDAAVLYKEHAAKAGINIQVVRESNDGYWSSVWLKKPWCACYWGGYATEDLMLSTGYSAGAAWNDTHWNHEGFNERLITARAELDEEKRRGMYEEMQRILRDEGGAVVPMFANAIDARTDKVAHGKVSGITPLDGRRLIERWWLG